MLSAFLPNVICTQRFIVIFIDNNVNIGIFYFKFMFIRKTITALLGFIFLASLATAQQAGLELIDTADLKEHLTFIASDELRGRKLGAEDEGLNKAADYIATNALRLGLKPGVPVYFQKVDVVYTKPDDTNFIEVTEENGKSKYKSNTLVEMNHPSESQLLVGVEVVFTGFGDDLSSVDINQSGIIKRINCLAYIFAAVIDNNNLQIFVGLAQYTGQCLI